MKKILLLIAVSLMTGTYCYAQFSKGMICVGLGISIHSETDENEYGDPQFNVTKDEFNTSKTGFDIGGQYFITDNFSAGIKIGIDNRSDEEVNTDTNPFGVTSNTNTTTTNKMMFKAAANLYSNTGKIGLVGGLHAGIVTGSHEDEQIQATRMSTQTQLDEYKVSGFLVGLVPGVYAQITPQLFVMAAMGGLKYHSTSFDLDKVSIDGMSQDLGGYKDEETEKGFWLDFNPRNYRFSLTYYFGGSGGS